MMSCLSPLLTKGVDHCLCEFMWVGSGRVMIIGAMMDNFVSNVHDTYCD